MTPWEEAAEKKKEKPPWELAAEGNDAPPPSDDFPSTQEEWQKQIASEVGTLEAMAIGAGRTVDKTIRGLKDLFTDVEERDETEEAGYAALKEESPLATGGGEVLGEIAQFALPAGAALKGAKAINKAKTLKDLGWQGTLGAEMLAGLAYGAGRETGGVEERLDAGTKEAALALAGFGTGKMLGRAAEGIRGSESAQKLKELGVQLTPGMAGYKWLTGVEDAMEFIPLLGAHVRKGKEKAVRQYSDEVIRQAAPSAEAADRITGTGFNAYKQLSGEFDDAYKSAWGSVDSVNPESFKGIAGTLITGAKNIPKKQRNILKPLGEAHVNLFNAIKKGEGVATAARQFDDALKTARDQASVLTRKGKGADLSGIIRDARNLFRDSLGDAGAELDRLDSLIPSKKAVRDATKSAAKNAGDFTPEQLMSASVRRSAGDAASRGEGPLQDIALAGIESISMPNSAEPFNWLRKIMSRAVPGMPGVGTAGRALMGNTPVQKGMKRLDQMTPDEMIEYILGAAAVTGTGE